jgi:putative ABC transport system permease protein
VLLGVLLAPAFARLLVHTGFAPSGFTAHFVFWAVTPAFGTGLLVALLGAWAAAWRAGRIRPVEALREAAVDRRPMTVGRTVLGLLAFAGSVPLIAVLMAHPSAAGVALIIIAAMLLIMGFALFAPLVIPPLAWLLTVPLAASPGAVGLLARHNARGAVRRTAATAAPILVTLGIAGSMLTGFGTLQAATDSAARDQITADALVVPAVGAGLPDAAVQALREIPGVRAAVPVTDASVYVRDDGDPEAWTARYATGPDLAAVLDAPVTAGRLADLTGTDTVAVPAGSRWKLGERAELWLADSTPVRPRVAAVLGRRLDLDETLLLPAALRTGHEPAIATVVYLRLSAEATRSTAARAAVAAEVATATAGAGKLVGTDEYLSAANSEQGRANRMASVVLLGLALVYTVIAIANTLVMATRDRAGEFATVRLAGATRRQVLAVVAAEAALVTVIGATLAATVTGITAWGARYGLAQLAPSVPVVVPWATLGAIAAACLMVALVASIVPAALLLRRDPADLAAVRE